MVYLGLGLEVGVECLGGYGPKGGGVGIARYHCSLRPGNSIFSIPDTIKLTRTKVHVSASASQKSPRGSIYRGVGGVRSGLHNGPSGFIPNPVLGSSLCHVSSTMIPRPPVNRPMMCRTRARARPQGVQARRAGELPGRTEEHRLPDVSSSFYLRSLCFSSVVNSHYRA